MRAVCGPAFEWASRAKKAFLNGLIELFSKLFHSDVKIHTKVRGSVQEIHG